MHPAPRLPRHDQRSPAVLVTDAAVPRSVERDGRQRRYLISMAVRTVSFILAVVLFHGWAQLVAVAVSMVMPWIAVLVANAGPARRDERPAFFSPPSPRALPGAQPDDAEASHAAGS